MASAAPDTSVISPPVTTVRAAALVEGRSMPKPDVLLMVRLPSGTVAPMGPVMVVGAEPVLIVRLFAKAVWPSIVPAKLTKLFVVARVTLDVIRALSL